MKWQITEKARMTPLAFAGLLLAGHVQAADGQTQKQEAELLRRLAHSDARAAALQAKIAQLEARMHTLRAAVEAAAATSARSSSMMPVAARPALLAQADNRPQERTPTRKRQDRNATPQNAAPGAFEVDEEAAQRALERTLTQSGALLLPPRTYELTPSFTFRRDELSTMVPASFTPPGGGGPATVLINQRTRRNERLARLDLRAGMPFETQLELSLPYSYVNSRQVTDFGSATEASGSSVGDVTLGVAKTFAREDGWKPDLIGRLSYTFGNGDRQDGGVPLTGGYRQLQTELVAIKRQDPVAFVGSVFVGRSFEKDGIRPGDVAGFSLSSVLAASPATSLQFGFSQIYRTEQKVFGIETPGSEQTYGLFNIGSSSVLSRDLTLVTSFGIGLGSDAPEYSFTISLPYLLR